MPAQEIRREAYEIVASITQAMGSPARLKMIQLLAQSPKSVEALSELSGESLPNTSQHLQRLLKEKLVACQRQGNKRIYEISNNQVLRTWELLQELAFASSPRIRETEELLIPSSLVTEDDALSLVAKLRKNRVTLVDCRNEEESHATPVRGAKNIPLRELAERKGEIPKSLPVIFVCRGRYCTLASEAVVRFRRWGFKAYRVRESAFRLNQFLKECA